MHLTDETPDAQNDRVVGEIASLLQKELQEAAEKHSTGEIAVKVIVRDGKAQRAQLTPLAITIQ